jgi:hypothetical protein
MSFSLVVSIKKVTAPANQSLKLTAEAEVETRGAQENEFVVAARRQCWTALRIVR